MFGSAVALPQASVCPYQHAYRKAWCKCNLHCVPPAQVELRPQDLSWERFLDAVPQPAVLRAHVAGGEEVTGVIFSSGTTGGLHLYWAVMGMGAAPAFSPLGFVVALPAGLHQVRHSASTAPSLHILPRRRAQGHPLDPHHAAALRRRRLLPPGRAAGGRAVLAHQHGLDDGPLAGVRRWGSCGVA